MALPIVDASDETSVVEESRYQIITVMPGWLHPIPKPVPQKLNWVFSNLFIRLLTSFRISDQKLHKYYLLFDGVSLVHYMLVIPKILRYPFMGNNDIQISFVTEKDFRGRGILAYVINRVAADYHLRCDYVWGITNENNTSSIKGMEKAGMSFFAFATKPKLPWGKVLLQTPTNEYMGPLNH